MRRWSPGKPQARLCEMSFFANIRQFNKFHSTYMKVQLLENYKAYLLHENNES
jgi:hypothetical protein